MQNGGEENEVARFSHPQQARPQSAQPPESAENTDGSSSTHAGQGPCIDGARGAAASPPAAFAPAHSESTQLSTAFAARALTATSRSTSNSTATIGSSSFEGSLRRSPRLPPLPEQQQQDSDTPNRLPEQPATRLPPAAPLHGANSISNASPFMQQQMNDINSDGSSRWRSGWLAAATTAQAAKPPPPGIGLGGPFAVAAAHPAVSSEPEGHAGREEGAEAMPGAEEAVLSTCQINSEDTALPAVPPQLPGSQAVEQGRPAAASTQRHHHQPRHQQSPHLRPQPAAAGAAPVAAAAAPVSALPLDRHPRSPRSPHRPRSLKVLAHAAQPRAEEISGAAEPAQAASHPAAMPATPQPNEVPPQQQQQPTPLTASPPPAEPQTAAAGVYQQLQQPQQLQVTLLPPPLSPPQQHQHQQSVVGSPGSTSAFLSLQLPQPPVLVPPEAGAAGQLALSAAAAQPAVIHPAVIQSAELVTTLMPHGPSLEGTPVQPGQSLKNMLTRQQQQAAALAALQQQQQQQEASLAPPALHPAAAAAFANASPAARAAMIAALSQQQERQEQQAAAVAEQERLQALLPAMLHAQHAAAAFGLAGEAGSQQGRTAAEVQQGAQLTAQQMQQQQRLLQGQQAAAVAAMQQLTVQQQYQQPFMQYQSLAAASLPAIPLPPPAPAQQAPAWLMPPPLPGLFQPHSQPGLLPATPDQQPEQQGSYGFCESVFLSRQSSQALSGYSEAASGSMALPQYQLPQCMMPGGEAALRFSGPAASRSSAMGGDAVQRQAGHAKARLAEAAASQSALAGVLSQKQRVSKCS